MKDTFDAVPISATFNLKPESSSLQRSLEMLGTIGEIHGVFDLVFLVEFLQEHLSQRCRSRRIQPHM